MLPSDALHSLLTPPSSEGDHIKVTASRYPFPTVCADTQSTDWFHSISRTLKWNERERQKSFVVVEESPGRKRTKTRKSSPGPADTPTPVPAGATLHKPLREPSKLDAKDDDEDEDEEDEVSDEGEEQEEKYDIDDLSSNDSPTGMDAAIKRNKVKPSEENLGREKVLEQALAEVQEERDRSQQALAELAAHSLYQGSPFQSGRHHSGVHSGIETPDRYAGNHPHPPKVSLRHVAFAPFSSGSEMSLSSMWTEQESHRGERGLRDEIHSPKMHAGTRSRIPRDRELETETMKTPTVQSREGQWRRRLSRSRSRERGHGHGHEGSGGRAFAVWGQDESDSATSDSDV